MTKSITGGASLASILAAIGTSFSWPKIRTRKMYAAKPTQNQVSDIAKWNAAVEAKRQAKMARKVSR